MDTKTTQAPRGQHAAGTGHGEERSNGATPTTTPKREPEKLTAIDALARIGKILDKCDAPTRDRVLDFLTKEHGVGR